MVSDAVSPTPKEHKDFFISYNGADEEWAEWIAWQLEHAGFSSILQAWDFRPGNNFVVEMDRASRIAERTIVVLSPNFFGSSFTPPEWANAFAKDPTGGKRSMVPVRVEDCDVEGLLGQVVSIDLIGLARDEASKKLLAGVQPGRSKPTSEPEFPGANPRVEAPRTIPARNSAGLIWEKTADVPVVWRSQLSRSYRGQGGPTVAEVQLVPLEDALLKVRRLADLPDELAGAGRSGGLFSASEQLTTDATSDFAYVRSIGNFSAESAGLMVTRSGQRGAWVSLPHDSMGSVLDEADLTTRIASVLALLLNLDLPVASRYAVTASLGPTSMLTVGSSAIVGNRHSASMLGVTGNEIVLPVEDSVNSDAIATHASELAEELVARLVARTKRRN
jgi:hypothetical protein